MRHFTRSAVMAIAMMLAIAAPAAFANGTNQNSKLRLTLADLPSTVTPGQSMRGTIQLDNLTTAQQNVTLNFLLVTPLGNLPVRSAAVNISPSATKIKRSSFTVLEEARPGSYRLVIAATVDNQTITVFHDFTVVPK